MNLKGTQTEKNLKAAFAGESMARNRYTFFAEQAKKQGLTEMEEFFNRMALNEKEHARLWYKLLYGQVTDTLNNLESAAQGEHDEWTDMYVRFAKEAKEEGFIEIAQLFSDVKRIERNHEREILKMMSALTTHKVPEQLQNNIWVCGYCGFSGESSDIPSECPLCKQPVIQL